MSSFASSSYTLVPAGPSQIHQLIPYEDATGDRHPDGPDVWLSTLGNKSSDVLPGIPMPYLQDVLDGRALYALGVPVDWQVAEFKEIFKHCGQVVKCPCVIDLKSEQVFRWVIMASSEEATAVLSDINGMLLAGRIVYFCRALPPGAAFAFSEEYPLYEFMKWDLKPPLLTTPGGGQHGPILPVMPQPVTVVVQPPTPTTVHAHPARPDTQEEQPPAVLQPTSLPRQMLRFTGSDLTDDFVPQAVTWANIVRAREGVRAADGTFSKTEIKLPGSGPRLSTVGRIPSFTRSRPFEPLAQQMRVVLLLKIPSHVTLTNISDAVKEGSLHSIRFGIDKSDDQRYAGIIFQHAHEAELFFRTINKERIDCKPDRLPFITQATRGEKFPSDDMIKLMGAPTFASRRLTVVKSRFFFMYKEAEFRRFCEQIVGPTQIQCIWLYNGGNATVIFADVKSAVMVKKELDKLSGAAKDESNSFYGLQVTYSKDPCLQELHFVTDIHE